VTTITVASAEITLPDFAIVHDHEDLGGTEKNPRHGSIQSVVVA
jgi:hypothetical protein